MKMPEPTITLHGKTKGGKLSEQKLELYDAEKMKQYGRDLLEEAAKECDRECDNWDEERPLRIAATAIRKLKETL